MDDKYRPAKFEWLRIFNAIALSVAAGQIASYYENGIFGQQHGCSDEPAKTILFQKVLKIGARFFNVLHVEIKHPERPNFTDSQIAIVQNTMELIGESAGIATLILASLSQGEVNKTKLAEKLTNITNLCSKLSDLSK